VRRAAAPRSVAVEQYVTERSTSASYVLLY
jgi:hypothetical protein